MSKRFAKLTSDELAGLVKTALRGDRASVRISPHHPGAIIADYDYHSNFSVDLFNDIRKLDTPDELISMIKIRRHQMAINVIRRIAEHFKIEVKIS